MARLAGVDIPNEKRIEIALTYIFGVGRTRAKETLAATTLSLHDALPICHRRKIQINCYQGQRHRKGLPVRGQRTKTNARTRKGPKRTVAGKKKATK